MGKRIKITAAAISIACILCCLLTSVVWAADPPPDTITIDSSAVATGLIEDGDYLFMAQYDVAWELESNYPDGPINEKIIVQLLSQSGSVTYAATAPFVYYNNGYDNGIVSFYLSPLVAINYNIEWEGQYKLRIITLPSVFTSTKYYEYAIPANDYCNSGSKSSIANRNWVATYCLNTAKALKVSWGISTALTSQSIYEVLSEYGEAYYGSAIPGLKRLCPQLYLATDTVPEFTETVYTGTHASALQNQWEGQDNVITDGIDGAAGLFGGGNSVFAMNMISLGIMLALIIVSGAMFKSLGPGILASSVVMLVFTDLGWFEVALLGVITFLYILYGVNKTLSLRHA